MAAHAPAQAAGQRYTIRQSLLNNSNAGLGMFAATFIEAGRDIVEERPLLGFFVDGVVSATAVTRVINDELHGRTTKVNYHFGHLSVRDKALFRRLTVHQPQGINNQRACRFVTNCFSTPYTNNNGQSSTYFGVARDISRANHHCMPNAIVDWNANSDRFKMIALTNIYPGTEITINYLAEDHLKTRAQRRTILQRHYGFQCQCPVCTNHAASDANRTRLRNLYTALQLGRNRAGAPGADQGQVMGQLSEYIRLLQEEGFRDTSLAWGYRYQAIHFAAMGQQHVAEDRAKMATDLFGMCLGNGHPEVEAQVVWRNALLEEGFRRTRNFQRYF